MQKKNPSLILPNQNHVHSMRKKVIIRDAIAVAEDDLVIGIRAVQFVTMLYTLITTMR
jgi:hypothetical protein